MSLLFSLGGLYDLVAFFGAGTLLLLICVVDAARRKLMGSKEREGDDS